MRSAGRLLKEREDVQQAREEAVRVEQEVTLLGDELRQKLAALSAQFDPSAAVVESFTLTPRKTDIFDVRVSLLWEPDFAFTPLAKPDQG